MNENSPGKERSVLKNISRAVILLLLIGSVIAISAHMYFSNTFGDLYLQTLDETISEVVGAEPNIIDYSNFDTPTIAQPQLIPTLSPAIVEVFTGVSESNPPSTNLTDTNQDSESSPQPIENLNLTEFPTFENNVYNNLIRGVEYGLAKMATTETNPDRLAAIKRVRERLKNNEDISLNVVITDTGHGDRTYVTQNPADKDIGNSDGVLHIVISTENNRVFSFGRDAKVGWPYTGNNGEILWYVGDSPEHTGRILNLANPLLSPEDEDGNRGYLQYPDGSIQSHINNDMSKIFTSLTGEKGFSHMLFSYGRLVELAPVVFNFDEITVTFKNDYNAANGAFESGVQHIPPGEVTLTPQTLFGLIRQRPAAGDSHKRGIYFFSCIDFESTTKILSNINLEPLLEELISFDTDTSQIASYSPDDAVFIEALHLANDSYTQQDGTSLINILTASLIAELTSELAGAFAQDPTNISLPFFIGMPGPSVEELQQGTQTQGYFRRIIQEEKAKGDTSPILNTNSP